MNTSHHESHLCHLHLESLKIARIVCIFAEIPSHSIKLENINDGCAILGIPWHGVSQHIIKSWVLLPIVIFFLIWQMQQQGQSG